MGERLPDEGAARAVERRGGCLTRAGVALFVVCFVVCFALVFGASELPGWSETAGFGLVIGCVLAVTGLVIEHVGGFARFRIERRAKPAPSEGADQKARAEDEE